MAFLAGPIWAKKGFLCISRPLFIFPLSLLCPYLTFLSHEAKRNKGTAVYFLSLSTSLPHDLLCRERRVATTFFFFSFLQIIRRVGLTTDGWTRRIYGYGSKALGGRRQCLGQQLDMNVKVTSWNFMGLLIVITDKTEQMDKQTIVQYRRLVTSIIRTRRKQSSCS